MSVRYRIAPDVHHLNFLPNFSTYKESEIISVNFPYINDFIYYVDILEVRGRSAKMRVYMPDAQDVVGWQNLDWISLENYDELLDGRFNRVGGKT